MAVVIEWLAGLVDPKDIFFKYYDFRSFINSVLPFESIIESWFLLVSYCWLFKIFKINSTMEFYELKFMQPLLSQLITLTFKCGRWGFGCSESIDTRQWSVTSFITCLDFKFVLSVFTQSLHFVNLTRSMVNDRKSGNGDRDGRNNVINQ